MIGFAACKGVQGSHGSWRISWSVFSSLFGSDSVTVQPELRDFMRLGSCAVGYATIKQCPFLEASMKPSHYMAGRKPLHCVFHKWRMIYSWVTVFYLFLTSPYSHLVYITKMWTSDTPWRLVCWRREHFSDVWIFARPCHQNGSGYIAHCFPSSGNGAEIDRYGGQLWTVRSAKCGDDSYNNTKVWRPQRFMCERSPRDQRCTRRSDTVWRKKRRALKVSQPLSLKSSARCLLGRVRPGKLFSF